MTEAQKQTVSYITFEGEMTRMERTNHRLWILCILMLVSLLGTNGAWIWYESSFEEVVITQDNTRGYNNYIGGDGDITNDKLPDEEIDTEPNS